MKNKNKVNGTDTFVPDFHLTSRTDLFESLDEFLGREEATTAIKVREASAVLVEVTEGTTGRHRYSSIVIFPHSTTLSFRGKFEF